MPGKKVSHFGLVLLYETDRAMRDTDDKGPLLQAPIPLASNDMQKEVAQYVDQFQIIFADMAKLDPILYEEERSELQEKINKFEDELDNLIYDIYELDQAERNIIQSNTLALDT